MTNGAYLVVVIVANSSRQRNGAPPRSTRAIEPIAPTPNPASLVPPTNGMSRSRDPFTTITLVGGRVSEIPPAAGEKMLENNTHEFQVEVQEKRVKTMGYESFRDMLAHILAWWEEGMPIILAIAEDRPFERKKYDFDVFNAEAVAKYKTWDEREFLAHFEKTRQKIAADFQSMNDAAFENRRIKGWADGIFIHHAREHLVDLCPQLGWPVLLERNRYAQPLIVRALHDADVRAGGLALLASGVFVCTISM